MGTATTDSMPLGLIDGLPSGQTLEAEGITILPHGTPGALKLMCLNLMPLKEDTERQLGRNFGQHSITVDMHFVMPDGAKGKNTDPKHLAKYYSKFSEVINENYDGVIVTGAPLEHLAFEQVAYWPEMVVIMDWIKSREIACYYLCWGALASLYHYYDIPMHWQPQKLFGLYPHEVLKDCEMTNGLEMPVSVPVSRHVKHNMEDMTKLGAGVELVVNNDITGPCVMWDRERCFCYMLNHFEYEWDTLDGEYRRDLKKGSPDGSETQIPAYYYPDDDPSKPVVHSWLQNGIVFYNNWITEVQKHVQKKKNAQNQLQSAPARSRL